MTNLSTEARELCAIDIENRPIYAEVIIDELCDALEKAENRIKLLEGAIERQNNTITYLNSANDRGFNW